MFTFCMDEITTLFLSCIVIMVRIATTLGVWYFCNRKQEFFEMSFHVLVRNHAMLIIYKSVQITLAFCRGVCVFPSPDNF